MLLPYRCKNPPESYPYVTVGLIVLNTLIYLCTTYSFLQVKDGVIADWAVSPDTIHQGYRIFSAMFLHADPMHLLGNMLFLWLFGSAVEGRLRSLKFSLLYFGAGVCGQILQTISQVAIGNHHGFGLGASGAIMGLAGAYIYMFPHAIIVVFRLPFNIWALVRGWIGPADWKAWWVICYYMGFNVLNAIIAQWLHLRGGTAFMAHIGGFGGGLLIAMAFRVKRDTEVYAMAQAVRTDVKGDFHKMSLSELDTLLDVPTDNMEIVTTYCWKAMTDGGPSGEGKCLKMLNRYKLRLVESGDAFKIAAIVLRLPQTQEALPPVFFLKLGGKLEGVGGQDEAGLCYRRVFEMNKTAKDAEIALMRLGRMLENHYKNPDQAREAYSVLLTLFPTGMGAEEAQKALTRLSGATPTGARG